MEVTCTLRRARGSPIVARTVEFGLGGMSVTSPRPLATDETLGFAVDELDGASGEARVLRQQSSARYALRFERVPDTLRRRLEALVAAAAPPDA
jgi:hypothetical protein